ncbi:fosfomycin resistance glutathione transferase [Enterobacteriaceae bacterium BIT-l23]|uniref:Fosfomycin resistance glutathione transferase n=1 Tax=Jejubacter calystegiae TaxID=2579935 RepID=A0A4P8YRF3_9ENTR|nr:fosfomycin resistance glutathione transferase [Jejubacter calystegiae]NUU68931.1 fosfomycin resistance glutathione transferase [Enterobacteriaceae bacterium BIT-l23]QCT21322.1 fosfomycin resistance glutathione transferase [Jejubacter calystegiae]
MLTGLNHLTLAVSDLTRSIGFYHDILGLKLEARWETGAYLSLPGLWLCLSFDPRRQTGEPRDYTHYAFSTDGAEFETMVNKLRAGCVREWKRNTSEGESFYFLDPDSHQLELHVGSLSSRLAQCRRAPYKNMQFFD